MYLLIVYIIIEKQDQRYILEIESLSKILRIMEPGVGGSNIFWYIRSTYIRK